MEAVFIREQSHFIAIEHVLPLVTSDLNGFDIMLPGMKLEKRHRTNCYDALRNISTYYTVANGSVAFDTLQQRLPHIRVYYICSHILTTFVNILHLIKPP